jgi:hypothetical protein
MVHTRQEIQASPGPAPAAWGVAPSRSRSGASSGWIAPANSRRFLRADSGSLYAIKAC